MGRYPKHPSDRRQGGNRASTTTVIAPHFGPDIPEPVGARDWSEDTFEWWRAVWSSPVAEALYLPGDAYPLVRLGNMLESIRTGEASAAVMGEARQLEDRFGLSPVARRRLGVFVDRRTAAEIDGSASAVVSLDAARIARVLSD
jgi:hypothetical protein